MKIYVTHSSAFDYQNQLYKPLRNSELNNIHQIILPHEKSDQLTSSIEFMKTCDLIIAEVSYPSTGQGIELGWADMLKIPIVCMYKKEAKPSNGLKVITNDFFEYESESDMIDQLSRLLTPATGNSL